MAELGEMLKQLLESGDNFTQVFEATETLWQQSGRDCTEGNDNADESSGGGASACLGQLFGALRGQSQAADEGADKPQGSTSGSFMSGLPQLLLAFSGKNSYIDQKRLNLVSAIKPYMTDERADNVDRAIKMANMAMAAKMALGLKER